VPPGRTPVERATASPGSSADRGRSDLLEQNQVLVGSTLYAIVKLPDGVSYTDLTYELNDKGKLGVTLTPSLVEDCAGRPWASFCSKMSAAVVGFGGVGRDFVPADGPMTAGAERPQPPCPAGAALAHHVRGGGATRFQSPARKWANTLRTHRASRLRTGRQDGSSVRRETGGSSRGGLARSAAPLPRVHRVQVPLRHALGTRETASTACNRTCGPVDEGDPHFP
jgi:hypothetical protein